MAKQIVGRDFSHYARRYVRGQEVDSAQFAPDVLKSFQDQGKLVPASSNKASAVANDPAVQDMRGKLEEAQRIASGENPDGVNKQH